ncbi:GNAT family N-acetyltransferase [Phenylobacterium sp.]|uniref:GNAT family N-acetyltransferase n=1 Tax=Phenylobacterium sp. TaxID=1871053 RepID=UPI0035B176CB
MSEVRPIRLPQDADAVEALDASVETDAILAAIPGETGFEFLIMGDRATKRFDLEGLFLRDEPWDSAWVAIEDDAICGFAATGFEPDNRRLTIEHFYVDAHSRRKGVGWELMQAVQAEAARRGALHIWLMTGNRNLPGIEAMKAMGFQITGLDLTVYDGTDQEGEFAVFLSRMMD